MTTTQARYRIERAIEQGGRYAHNMVSVALLDVLRREGREQADRLIDEYRLDVLYGIEKQGRDDETRREMGPSGLH